jgi:hypothetical protein
LNLSNKIVWFEYFTATGCDEGISGEQGCEIGVNNQRFRYCVLNIKAGERERLKKVKYYIERG